MERAAAKGIVRSLFERLDAQCQPDRPDDASPEGCSAYEAGPAAARAPRVNAFGVNGGLSYRF